MRIAIGSDKSGFSLKESIKNYLIQENISFDDLGTQSSEKGIPYFQVAEKIAREVAQGKYDRAILICGTGMGMSIVSNKHKGVYAACVESVHTAKLSRHKQRQYFMPWRVAYRTRKSHRNGKSILKHSILARVGGLETEIFDKCRKRSQEN